MQNIFSGVEHHIAQRIADEEISTQPFAHCVIDNVFPDDVFQAIHEMWPSDQVLKPLPETKRTSAYDERYVMLFEPEFLDKLSSSDRQFWIAAALASMGPEVSVACYQKFKSVLQPRIAHIEGDVELAPEMLVVSDRGGYKIGPHTDSPARFVSMLYYLSPEPEYESYGTGLYQPKNGFVPRDYAAHNRFEDFKLHTRVDFKPNRLVIFPRSNMSYHGVEPVEVEGCDRRLFIVNIRAPAGAR